MNPDDLRQLDNALILCTRAARVFGTLLSSPAPVRSWLAHPGGSDPWVAERRLRKGLVKGLAFGWDFAIWRNAPASKVFIRPGYYAGSGSAELGIDVVTGTVGLATALRGLAQPDPPWRIGGSRKVVIGARIDDRNFSVDESVGWLGDRLRELSESGWLDTFDKAGNRGAGS